MKINEKTVMIYLFNKDDVLFIFRNKKKIDLNKNKYIGIGGHIENNETPIDAIVRETKEETNLDLIDIKYRGQLYFINNNYIELIYLYTSNKYKGNINNNCNEGELIWINKNNINSINLWEGDKYFIYDLINNSNIINLTLYYDNDKLIKVIDNINNILFNI